ncbi:MAG: GNAT family N-acetyltransferase [Rhodobacteraceae bacterium]|nr:GNAT family N-acetyltransferase [Paracoccaceae bacterium]
MIGLAPLPRTRCGEVLHLELGEGQQDFVHPIADMVREDRPGVDFHVIRAGTQAVGFFKTDIGYADRHGFARPGEPGLRGMLIGAQYQGRGYGKAAMAALPGYLARFLPKHDAVLLTVNCRNPTALRVYLSGGWLDTGATYEGGNSGPQHILRLSLPKPSAAPEPSD